ncbi:MAG: hypothetical protein KGS61_10875 [Verrucomicrobia bacterium]|nr:hypothetical protein [Verrucomicrobiota bacterium]
MNTRVLLGSSLCVVCLLLLWNVVEQKGELARLHAGLVNHADQARSRPTVSSAAPPVPSAAEVAVPVKVLRLRGQVGMLRVRLRELAAVRAENERLRAQVAATATNPAAGGLPAGYLLRSQAKWSGFSTPENTLQTFLWAAQHRDLTNLLQVFTPEAAGRFQNQIQQGVHSASEFFDDVSGVPGVRILDRQPQPDGSVVLNVQIDPRRPDGIEISARLVNGEWKLDTF